MSDRIYIRDLLLRAVIGVNDEERRDRQDVLINITLDADTKAAGASDRIEDAVNYRTLTKQIIHLVEGSQFYLVEKMAAEIAGLCLADPRVRQATVRVEKPGALRFARSVGVEVSRTASDLGPTRHAFISLGSNINAEENLQEAVRRLATRCRVLAVSRVYQTRPVGSTGQPDFLNASAVVETKLSAAELKKQVLEEIEREMGRVRRSDKYAPRTIDLDISLFGDKVFELGARHIPDPEILRFAYLARPLADVAPQVRHPETGQTLLEIAGGLEDREIALRQDVSLWLG